MTTPLMDFMRKNIRCDFKDIQRRLHDDVNFSNNIKTQKKYLPNTRYTKYHSFISFLAKNIIKMNLKNENSKFLDMLFITFLEIFP